MVAINESKKSWQDKNVKERLETLADIEVGVAKEISKEEEEKREKRRQILNLDKNEPEIIKHYRFTLPNDLNLNERDEEKVKNILENIAQIRYRNKPERYQIFEDTDSKSHLCMWASLELRWPSHYAGFIDSIYFLRNDTLLNQPAEINISFVRGKNEISDSTKSTCLEQEAKKVYEQIKSQL